MQRKGDNPTSIPRFSAMKKFNLTYILFYNFNNWNHSYASQSKFNHVILCLCFFLQKLLTIFFLLLKHEEQLKLIKWKFQSLKTDFLYFFFKWENLISLMDLKIKLKFFRLFRVSELMYILSRKIITKV